MDDNYYKLTPTSEDFRGGKVFRIQATKDIEKLGVKKGDFGGLVQDRCLSGNAWICEKSFMAKGCIASENVHIINSKISGKVSISDNCTIQNSKISGSAFIRNYCTLDNVIMLGSNAEITNSIRLNNVNAMGNLILNNNLIVSNSLIHGEINIISKESGYIEDCYLYGKIVAKKNFILKDVELSGKFEIKPNVMVQGKDNVLLISNFGENSKTIGSMLFYKDFGGEIKVSGEMFQEVLTLSEFSLKMKQVKEVFKNPEKTLERVKETISYVMKFFLENNN